MSVEHASEVTVLSERQSRAVQLHGYAKSQAQIAENALFEMGKALKEIRDDELYKELEYTSFDSYCRAEFNMSSRGAYHRIGIVENLPEDFVTARSQIGFTKFRMIAFADEPVKAQIMQQDDLESISSRKLETRIKELEAKQKQSESRISELESENQKSAQALDEVTADKNQIQSEFEEFREGANRRQQMLMTNLQKRKTHEEELEAQLEELENRPRDTVFEKDPAILEENAKLKTENQELKTKLSEQPAVQEMLPCDGESFSERRAEFNAYLKALSDAMNHICAFIAKYQENHRISEVEKTIEKYINAMKG